ncbi:MAG TPA: S8 family peptidase [Actinomycetota bacterium]
MMAARYTGGRTPVAMFLSFCLAVAGLAAAGAATSIEMQLPSIDPALSTTYQDTIPLIVQKRTTDGSPERSFERLGGHLTRSLPIIDGFAGTLPAAALDDLARVAGVRTLTLDRRVHVLEGSTAPDSVYRDVIGAPAVWSAGYDGTGVTVAVIDTGIASHPKLGSRIVKIPDPVTGLSTSCVNFSGEAGCADSYGHGTFVAGVVAAGGTHKGVAPGARVLSVKIAGRDGSADVSTLLAAIQWVVSFRDTYGIRVLNLSLGTDSPQPYLLDPLNFAVERAWNSGIVVVVAASNRGPGPATITKPADDPWVITVGAIDDRGTVGLDDDYVPNFSARGPTLSDSYAKPDLVAPGAHIVSLEAADSAIAQNYPSAIGGGYRRGSGTSFATPAVAGTVALMLQRTPSLTPNQVKHALLASARPTTSSDPFAVGAGVLDAATATLQTPQGEANQGLLQSSGTGSLHASRGTLLVTAGELGTVVEGQLTQQLTLFDQIGYTTTEWTGASWHGASWHGASWHGASWHGASWHGASWHGVEDENASYGEPWLGSAIYGAWG